MVETTGVTGAAAPAAATRRPSFRLWYMAAVLCLVNAIGFVDRQSLPLLVLQIEHDLGLSDTEMSLLIGLAFVMVFSGMGVPAGMLVDRVDRRRLLSAAVAFFALASICCAGAFSFLTMFLGRMAIGVGESVTGPAAISLVRDAFPRPWQAGAIGIWAMGATIGGAAALLGGGAVLAALKDAAVVHVPLIGDIHTWQFVLGVSGFCTLPIALLVLTIREPARQAAAGAQAAGLRDAFAYLGREWRLFLPLFLVNGLTIMMGIGFSIWMPAFLGRVWHLSRPDIGFHMGVITLCFAPASQFIAGFLVDKLERSGIRRAIPCVGIAVTILVFAPAVTVTHAPSLAWTWVLVATYLLIGTSLFTIGTAFIARVTPSNLVGKVASLHLFSIGICGTAIGPFVIAMVADHVYSGPAAIGDALATVLATCDVLALGLYIVLLRVLRGRAAAA